MSRLRKDGQQVDNAYHPQQLDNAVRAGVPERDGAAIRELGGNHGDKAGRLKGGSVAIASGKYLLLPGDDIISNNLTMPEPLYRVSRGRNEGDCTGNTLGCYRECSGERGPRWTHARP